MAKKYYSLSIFLLTAIKFEVMFGLIMASDKTGCTNEGK